MARFDARVSKLIAGAVDARMMPPIIEALAASSAHLERIERALDRANWAAASLAGEMDVVLNGLTREVFRLQAQVDKLQRSLGEAGRADPNVLSIHDAAEDNAPPHRTVADRARVG
jgi:hypothetical protein